MTIRFQFDPQKAIAAMAYFLAKDGGRMDKVKLMKLLYIADRDHFLEHGYPITGDMQYAMPLGPVPSSSFDLLNGDLLEWRDECLRALHTEDYSVTTRDQADTSCLSASERQVLDAVMQTHGATHQWKLVEETHEFLEYKEVFQEDTSTLIPYELMLRIYGTDAQFRHNRPVISPATAEHMVCPFPHSDEDL